MPKNNPKIIKKKPPSIIVKTKKANPSGINKSGRNMVTILGLLICSILFFSRSSAESSLGLQYDSSTWTIFVLANEALHFPHIWKYLSLSAPHWGQILPSTNFPVCSFFSVFWMWTSDEFLRVSFHPLLSAYVAALSKLCLLMYISSSSVGSRLAYKIAPVSYTHLTLPTKA